MINKLASFIAIKMVYNKSINADDIECYEYGLQLLISKILINFIIIVCGILTQKILASIFFSVIFSFLRQYTGGFHCKNAERCVIVSIMIYLSFLLVFKINISLISTILVILSLPAFIIIISFAPISSENKPITNKESEKYRITAIIISLLLLITTYFAYILKNELILYVTSCSLIADAILMVLNLLNIRRVENALENIIKGR